jgi:hypothetical protein
MEKKLIFLKIWFVEITRNSNDISRKIEKLNKFLNYIGEISCKAAKMG